MNEFLIITYSMIAGWTMRLFFNVGQEVVIERQENNRDHPSDKILVHPISFLAGVLWPIMGFIYIIVLLMENDR